MNKPHYLSALALLLTLAACAHAPKPVRINEVKTANHGMVYGQIVLPEPDWAMTHVMIQRIGKVYAGMGLRGVSERIHVTPDGRFAAENLEPGKYMLGGFVIGREQNWLGQAAMNYQIEVKPGGIHYLGSYNYVVVKGANIVRPGEFNLQQRRDHKRHAELLVWLEEAARGTGWQPKIQQELKRYRRYLPAK